MGIKAYSTTDDAEGEKTEIKIQKIPSLEKNRKNNKRSFYWKK